MSSGSNSNLKTGNAHEQVTISDRIRRVNDQYLAASSRANQSATKVNLQPNQPQTQNRKPRTSQSQLSALKPAESVDGTLFHNNTDLPTSLKKSTKPKKKRGRIIRRTILAIFVVLILAIASLAFWANSTYNYLKDAIQHETVLSAAPDDANNADVFLIVGNDSRGVDATEDVMGSRSDVMMLLIHSASGRDSLVSLPRDTRVLIPSFIDTKGLFGIPGQRIDEHYNKLNTAYSYGGPQLLIKTIENLTFLKIDHYVETGFDGLVNIVDTVGGINVCYDGVFDDPAMTLMWDGGCRDINGQEALAFSRIRHQDPLGDIGRALRQHQVISKVAQKLQKEIVDASPTNLYNVNLFLSVADNMLRDTTFDENTTLWDMKDLCLYFKNASQNIDLSTSVIPIVEQADWDEVLGSIVTVNINDVRAYFEELVK